jgi:predicted MFS family arabinose efflux permease
MRSLYLLIFITILNHSVFAGARVAISLYAIHLGATPFTVGMLMALFALLPMFFAVSIGRLTDRVGVRRPMLAGSVLLAAAALIPFVFQSLPSLYVSSVLLGSSFMVYHLSMQNIVGYMGRPEDRAANFSLASLGFSVSGLFGPLLTGFSIDHLGHAATFLALAAFPLVPIAVLGLNKLPFPRPPGHGKPPEPGRRIADLLGHRELRPIFIVTALLATAWDLFGFAIPIYGAHIGLSASKIGMVLAAFSGATFIIRLFLPAMSRRIPPWPLLVLSLLIAGFTFFLFPLLKDASFLMAVAFLLGLGLGMSQPMAMSIMHNATPPGRMGEAVGIRMTLINMSQFSMPLLFGALGTAVGMTPMFWATALMLTGGGWLARRHAERRARQAEPVKSA